MPYWDAMTMVLDHQEKVFYTGVWISPMTISLYMYNWWPGSNCTHSQSRGLLLLIGQFPLKEIATEYYRVSPVGTALLCSVTEDIT